MSQQSLTKCGSEAGYRRHQRQCEEACAECKEAHATHQREYREMMKKRAAENYVCVYYDEP